MSRDDAVLAIATLIALMPFWSGALVLSVDLPQHIAQAAIARDFPERGLDAFYRVDLFPRPYLGTTYLLIALGAGELSGRLALTLYAIALVLAVRALVRSAPDRDPKLAWFAPLFIASWPVAYGFLPYVLGLPPALAAIALARRDKLIAAGVLYAIALLFHPLAFAIAAIASLPLLRARPKLAIPLAVAALLFLAPSPDDHARFNDAYIATAWRMQIKHKVLDFALAYLPGDLDTVFAVPGALALAVAIAHRRRKRDAIDASALAVALLYLASPADLALGAHKVSLLGPRLVVAVWLFAIAAGPPKLHRAIAIAPLASTLALSALLSITAHRYGEAWRPALNAALDALDALPERAALEIEINPPKDSPVNTKLLAAPELHLHAHAMFTRASFDPRLFSTPQSAVQIREDAPDVANVRWTQSSTPAISVRSISVKSSSVRHRD